MKKNVLFILLILICSFSMFYAFIKANQAAKAGVELQELRQQVEEQKMEAERQAEMALQSAAEAKRKEVLSLELQELLEECRSK